ncbi:hypothetical protein RJZ90_006738 [Blastomyces dermatitidis]
MPEATNLKGKVPATSSPTQTPPFTPTNENPLHGMAWGQAEEFARLFVEAVRIAAASEPKEEASTSEPSKPPTSKSKDIPMGSIPDFKRVDPFAAGIRQRQSLRREKQWKRRALTSLISTPLSSELKLVSGYPNSIIITDMPSLKQRVTVRVNSEFIRKALRHVMGAANAIGLQEDKPIVCFALVAQAVTNQAQIDQKLLYNFLPDLKRYKARAAGAPEDKLKHISLFVNFITRTYQSVTEQLLPQLKAGQIAWDLLWAVMKPGCILYATCFGTEKPRCVVLNAVEQKEKHTGVEYYELSCSYIDCDRKSLGKSGIHLIIEKFSGLQAIHALPVFPLEYHPQHTRLRQNLIECRKKFCQLVGTHIQHCHGMAFSMHKGEPMQVKVNSRIGIDAAFFYEMNPNYYRPRVEASSSMRSDTDGNIWFNLDKLENKQRMKEKEKFKTTTDLVPDEFAVDDIHNIKWSPSLFKSLTIPDDKKHTLMTLTKTRLRIVPFLSFDDFVKGKGQGLNVLLFGPPGVGKTLTAEAMSEHFKQPLHPIPAAQLIMNPDKVEDNLTCIFQIAKWFNTLLLLNEADVFLEHQASINALKDANVTIFLRKLEYFQGIFFLTTNRETEFDEAILSRIHLKIKYEKLSQHQRKDIRASFTTRARTHQGPAVMSDHDLDRLAILNLNEREHLLRTTDHKPLWPLKSLHHPDFQLFSGVPLTFMPVHQCQVGHADQCRRMVGSEFLKTNDDIEVVDMTIKPDTPPRRPKKWPRTMRQQSSPVKHRYASRGRAQADQDTRCWQYRGLITRGPKGLKTTLKRGRYGGIKAGSTCTGAY